MPFLILLSLVQSVYNSSSSGLQTQRTPTGVVDSPSNKLILSVLLGLLGSSAPVNIPGSSFQQDRSGGLINPSPSSTSSPAFPHSFLQSSLHRENSLDHVSSCMREKNMCMWLRVCVCAFYVHMYLHMYVHLTAVSYPNSKFQPPLTGCGRIIGCEWSWQDLWDGVPIYEWGWWGWPL